MICFLYSISQRLSYWCGDFNPAMDSTWLQTIGGRWQSWNGRQRNFYELTWRSVQEQYAVYMILCMTLPNLFMEKDRFTIVHMGDQKDLLSRGPTRQLFSSIAISELFRMIIRRKTLHFSSQCCMQINTPMGQYRTCRSTIICEHFNSFHCTNIHVKQGTYSTWGISMPHTTCGSKSFPRKWEYYIIYRPLTFLIVRVLVDFLRIRSISQMSIISILMVTYH